MKIYFLLFPLADHQYNSKPSQVNAHRHGFNPGRRKAGKFKSAKVRMME
jgi:hypothetical protein